MKTSPKVPYYHSFLQKSLNASQRSKFGVYFSGKLYMRELKVNNNQTLVNSQPMHAHVLQTYTVVTV